MSKDFFDLNKLKKMKAHPMSVAMDTIFSSVVKSGAEARLESTTTFSGASDKLGAGMSDKDQELSLDDLGELEIGELEGNASPPEDSGLDLGEGAGLPNEGEAFHLDDSLPSLPSDLSESKDISLKDDEDDFGLSDQDDLAQDLSLEELENSEADLTLDEGASSDPDSDLELGDLELGLDENAGEDDLGLDLALGENSSEFNIDAFNINSEADSGLELSGEVETSRPDENEDVDADLSDDAKEKLREIDALMDLDASQVNLRHDSAALRGEIEVAEDNANISQDLDSPMVSPDLDLDGLNFAADEKEEVLKGEKPKVQKKKKEVQEKVEANTRELGRELKELSGAYSGDMERALATIANLRSDREELLAKIQMHEDEKLLHNRQSLTLRAELDERKIELSIIRRKLNDEISELKDKQNLNEERRLILEERYRTALQELDKAGQKSKIDVKKVQMRERELEQKLELLKADAEVQIRHRDLKILELKRKMDAMEFDVESMSNQEKRSVESRFELEDKLDKAIKTLRSAISVLEDDTDKASLLNVLKKNIDM